MAKKLLKAAKSLYTPMLLDNNFNNYDEYWAGRGFHAPSLGRAKRLSKLIKSNSTVLDIGCGDGTVLEYLQQHNGLKKAIGIDISASAIKHVESKGFEAHVIDITSPKFVKFISKKEFDYVIITEVLEHIQEPEAVVVALKGHIKNALFISVPNSGFFTHRLRLLFGRFPLVVIQQHVKEHIRFWTKRDFLYWANYHGYKVDRIVVTSGMGIKYLKFIENLMPGLFANQILYKLSKK